MPYTVYFRPGLLTSPQRAEERRRVSEEFEKAITRNKRALDTSFRGCEWIIII